MPIKARIDRLSTGIPTPIGIQVFGKYLGGMERLAKQIEAVVKTAPGIRTENALLLAYIFVDMRGRDIGNDLVDQVKCQPGCWITSTWTTAGKRRSSVARLKVVHPAPRTSTRR
jgi:hypothetical protein